MDASDVILRAAKDLFKAEQILRSLPSLRMTF
jgi:hypothetical protein